MSRFSLKLSDTREVEIFGEGGRTVDKAIRFYLDAIRSTAPNVAILELGSNDRGHGPIATGAMLSAIHVHIAVMAMALHYLFSYPTIVRVGIFVRAVFLYMHLPAQVALQIVENLGCHCKSEL